jgi:5-methylcytosine-specific restriction protein A
MTLGLDLDTVYRTIVSAAREQRFLSYGELAKAQEVEWGRYRNQIFVQLGKLLGISKENSWPYITSIVVTNENLENGQLSGAALESFVNDLRKRGVTVTNATSFAKAEQQKTFDWADLAPDHLPEGSLDQVEIQARVAGQRNKDEGSIAISEKTEWTPGVGAKLVLKIGPRQFSDILFHPKLAADWEGQRFQAPLPRTLDGKQIAPATLPDSFPVLIWTHHDERKKEQPGQGLVAEGYTFGIPGQNGDLMDVEIRDIRLVSPPISREQMEALASQSVAIASLLQHTTTRSVLLTELEAQDFGSAVAAFQAEKLKTMVEIAAKYGALAPANEEAEKGWTDLELTACLVAYLEMLANEQSGESYIKANANRGLRDNALASRSKGSVEFRMQNISAFLKQKGLPIIEGYKPRGNLGPSVTKQLEDALSRIGFEELGIYGPTFSRDELSDRARKLRGVQPLFKPLGNPKPRKMETSTTSYNRSPQVVAYVIQRAGGSCELCQMAAPFLKSNGDPFLEVHHVKPLAEDGPDIVENAAALCPNCHRACHLAVDCHKLRTLLIDRVDMLEAY